MKYRVTYPGITKDLYRDFATREEAEEFARKRRDRELHQWRNVHVDEINDSCPQQ